MGTWKYHTSHSYKNKDGKEVTFNTQLYQVGVYGIINPGIQTCMMPKDIVSAEKKLLRAKQKGEITDLVFGPEITVSDDTGLFIEVKT
jgi:hypothetical protein